MKTKRVKKSPAQLAFDRRRRATRRNEKLVSISTTDNHREILLTNGEGYRVRVKVVGPQPYIGFQIAWRALAIATE